MNLGYWLANERFVKIAARFMKYFCCLSIAGYIATVILCVSGKEVFILHTKAEKQETAVYAEEKQGVRIRFMTAGPEWDVHVWTDDNDRIDRSINIGLILMFSLYSVVGIISMVFLIRFFTNVQKGRAFTNKSANYLFCYGSLQLVDAFVLPLAGHFIAGVANLSAVGRMTFAAGGPGFLNKLAPCVVYIVAAYIIHYGFTLQDEVDHTL